MGVTPEQLSEYYPRLYHMAESDSWDGINKHGLLSTSSLLTLFEIAGDERRKIELCKREGSKEITHERHGRAVIRDQKPIVESKLRTALGGHMTPEEWYGLLNGKVFFWLTVERLTTLLSAREYRSKPHLVLTLETLPLASAYENSITLTSINSGNTLPIAHPRGRATFKNMKDYPFAERVKRGLYYTVVELAVEGGVPNVLDYTISAELMSSDGNRLTTINTLYAQ
jgi:Family of unknown function (DUF7002)